ncbi:MAG: phosphoenolpyruvate carboxykinase [Gammaproteobacteria bacterium]|nr:phosphoenolpyruvate carboxykinase [Gammaproteobacteria bacterium]MCH9743687.1 phosphoenolpyruvate carboxykinase [Gammaproteobacteria bacterium]
MKQSAHSRTHQDLSIKALVQHALDRGEATLSANNALLVTTGERTGRSPKDRFIVKDDNSQDTVDWGEINQPMDAAQFETWWRKAETFLADKEHFVSHLRVGQHAQYGVPVVVTTETAWHNLFAQHLFIHDGEHNPNQQLVWHIINVPSMTLDPETDKSRSDAAVAIDLSGRRVLLAGMRYAGEMKKAMFSVMNYFMPEHEILPMHCAANAGADGDVVLFFGLSGTGKTTLSADPDRFLIGDDEHGWSQDAVFNFEGGCYAKCIDLSEAREPVIWHAIRDGAIMENVVCDASGVPDYTDASLTKNTRAAYPREFIPQRVEQNAGGIPKTVIFLTCDLYGVLPPLSLLSKEQAAYYFLSGYTALVGSTEMGRSQGIQPTFSTCFGAPFFPRHATVYADLLMKRIEAAGCQVFLINTGWTGGACGEGGTRFDIPVTRAVVNAAISGAFDVNTVDVLPGFNLKIPRSLEGVDVELLDPRKSWVNQAAYDEKAAILIQQFQENFKRFDVSESIRQAGL